MRASPNSWWAQAVQNKLIAMVLAMIVIVPLLASAMNSSVQGMSALAFQGFAIVLLTTLLWNARWDLRRERVAAFLRTGPNLPVVLFLGLAVLSCLLSPFKGYSVQETLRLGAGVLLYFVVAYQFRRSEHLSKLVDVLLFVGVGAALLGFAQFASGTSYRASGTFGDPQLLASFLMILLPVVAVVALTEKVANRQLAAQVATVLMAAGLLLTQTRSGWIGAAAGLTALSGLSLMIARQRKGAGLATRKHEVVLPIMLLVVSLGVFVAFWPQRSLFLQRASTLPSFSTQATWQERAAWRNGALEMIRQRPLTGFGIGLFPVFQSRYSGVGLNLANQSTPIPPNMNEQAHNLYLQTAAELGLPGLFLLVSTLVVFLVAGFRRVRAMDAGIRRTLLMGSLGAIVAFAVDAFGSPSWQLSQTSMFFWLVLGIGVGCLRPHARQREESPVRLTVSPLVARPAAILSCLALAALLPSVLLAADQVYRVKLLHVDPSASATTVKGGIAVKLTALATFLMSDNSEQTFDVTQEPGTVFSIVSSGGFGYLTGANNSVYQTLPRKPEIVVIKAENTLGSDTLSGMVTLDVKR